MPKEEKHSNQILKTQQSALTGSTRVNVKEYDLNSVGAENKDLYMNSETQMMTRMPYSGSNESKKSKKLSKLFTSSDSHFV